MKYNILKSLFLSLIISLTFSTFVMADSMNMDNGSEKKVDGIKSELSFKNGKAQTGDGDIMVTLLDSNNKAITDATVTATAEMDKSMSMNMSDVKPITIEFQKGDAQGQYMGTANFSDKGKWIVKTTIKMGGQEKNVDFDVDVAGTGPNLGIIGGFVGVMALIIIVAAVKKKKTTKA